MELHFDQELSRLKETLLRMAATAEESVTTALRALVERDPELARKVDADDAILDRMEMEVDRTGVELIALRQPKATDLRFIIVAMKISGELERIGDQAVSIAHRAADLAKEPPLKPLLDIPSMAALVQSMTRDVLDAFVYAKPDLARDVIARDRQVDLLHEQLRRELTSFMVEDPHTITRALNLMTVARKLERIGDHATNMAEDVVYLYEARDIRHQNA
ncbi:MAG: phosphate signaling complex protein PhoU [Verrucomicrobiae bacterium]|nr:phosphate signaling complex protein PhoU [Verrucomicrobiae bacterium]